MVDVKPDLFFLGCVCSAALTGVIISPKHVLPYIVVTIHLALLVILTLRNGLSIRNGFQQMQVELGGFYDHLADGQDTTCLLYTSCHIHGHHAEDFNAEALL